MTTAPSFASNVFLNSLLWKTPENPYKRTNLTFAFVGAGPAEMENKKFIAHDWNASFDIGGQIKMMNGDVINLGGLRGDQAAVYLGLQAWANVTNLHFDNAPVAGKADIAFMLASNATLDRVAGKDAVGGTLPPDSKHPSASVVFADTAVLPNDQNKPNWTLKELLPGGFAYMHEIGHALGLDHPFDDGKVANDGSHEPYFPGATGSQNWGDYGFNQGAFTVMSYLSGLWLDGGNNAGLGAFDIAAAQVLYGVNTSYHAGNDKYVLPTGNDAGVGWMCLWDAGGIDTLSAETATTSAAVDLRAASLQAGDENAGGAASGVDGVKGGFTIANGVIIENAIGGSGDDWIRGNEYNNRLEGGKGNDTIVGGCGADTLIGGDGADTFWFKNIHDFHDKLGPGGAKVVDYISDFKSGVDKLSFYQFDTDPTDAYSPAAFKFIGNSVALKKDGSSQLMFSSQSNTLYGDINGDGAADFVVKMAAVSSLKSSDFIF